jgi:aminotransferase in exopolysaccharide biosynthesis
MNLNEQLVDKIKSLYPGQGFIPLHIPRFLGKEKEYLVDCIDSTFVSSVGQYVNRFEEMMQDITGAKYAVATMNGTAALHLAIRLLNVKPGDEIITQPLTFVATANAIAYEHATPHFVDVDEDTMGLSPSALKERLEEVAEVREGVCYNKETGNKISACIPMHTFGLPARIDKIVAVCNEYNIPVLEDSAESLGCYYNDQHTGTFGVLGTFSFNGNKTVTSGGGGAVVTNDEELAKRAKHLSTTAKVPHKWEYVHDEVGYNYRMPNVNAALACAQLEQLDRFIEVKREIFGEYKAFLQNVNEIHIQEEMSNTKSNYWLNAIRFENRENRDAFLEYSNSNGVMTRPAWHLMNKLAMFEHSPCGKLDTAEALANTVVNIPSSVNI